MEFIIYRPKIQHLINSKSKTFLRKTFNKKHLICKGLHDFSIFNLKKHTILQHDKNDNKQCLLTQVRAMYKKSAVMHLQTIGLKPYRRLNAPLNVHKQVEHLFPSIYVPNAPTNAAP